MFEWHDLEIGILALVKNMQVYTSHLFLKKYILNKTNAITIVIIVLLIIAGVILYVRRNDSASTTSTSTATTTTTGDTDTVPSPTSDSQSAPYVVTNASAAAALTTVVVKGTVIPNGSFTNYWYEYGPNQATLVNRTANYGIGSGFVSIPAPAYIKGLAKDTTYYFRLVAENQSGKMTGSQYAFKTSQDVPDPVGALLTVKTAAANGITKNSANVNGNITPNQAATQFWFEYGKTADLGSTTALSSVGDGIVQLPAGASLSNLVPATTYYFRLNAQNQFGTVNGGVLSFTTASASGR